MPNKTKENKKKKKTNNKNTTREAKDSKFNFDEEIVIGLRRIDEPQKEEKKKQVTNKKKNKSKQKENKKANQKVKKEKRKAKIKEQENSKIIIKSKYMTNYDEVEKRKSNKKNKKQKKKQPKQLTKQQEIAKAKRKKVFKIVRWFTLIAIIIGGIIYTLMSPIFNIYEITVQGNTKISTETIISLSELNIGDNIFDFRKSDIESNIKQNAYIDTVQIKRMLPNIIEVTVVEREATYQLSYGNAYVYINNQGYMLEITSEKGDMPVLTGYSTSGEDIVEGNRLCAEDLEKLEDVHEIMRAATGVDEELQDKIEEIDISDSDNYILSIPSEDKEVYLGSLLDLSTKMLWINALLESEKGTEGTIMLNVDLNNDMPYFNEKV